MSRRVVQNVPAPPRPAPRLPRQLRRFGCMAMLATLAACGSHPAQQRAPTQYNPSRYYPPPGSPSDPWGPYIREASGRFGIPEQWIRRVMRQESGGQEDVISWAGAMGLMQVMPETYDELRGRYNLGNDPFDPHNNILAGTAYLREMYDRFGSPGFLAAYNAGPNRMDRYLNNGTPLPAETVNYVAAIAPRLGPGTPLSGPLAVYAGGPTNRLATNTTAGGCDPDAAYDPDRPCAPLRPAVVQPVAVAAYTPPPYAPPSYAPPSYAPGSYGPGSYPRNACDPDAAYDPAHPCRPSPAVAPVAALAPVPAQASPPASRVRAPLYAQGFCDPDAAYDPTRPCQPSSASPIDVVPPEPPAQPAAPPPAPRRTTYAEGSRPLQERMVQTVAFAPGPPPGRWAIQVGTYASLAVAQTATEKARSALPDLLRTAKIELPPTAPFGSQVAFRAWLFGLSPSAAADACTKLSSRGMPCITVPPAHDSF